MGFVKLFGLAACVMPLLVACGGADPVATQAATGVPTPVAQAMRSTASAQVDGSLCSQSALAIGAYQWADDQCVVASALLKPSKALKVSASAVAPGATSGVDATAFFDWAEASYTSLFPGHKIDISSGTFVYRYYPETLTALGVSDGKVYGLGPITGNQLALIGNLSDFTCEVAPSQCAAPAAPTVGVAMAGNASASISFTQNSANTGSEASAFTATCTSGSSSFSGSAAASPVVVSGLTNGTTYNCSVKASNASGTSVASASVSVTPVATTRVGTEGVLCDYAYNAVNTSVSGALTSTAKWSCGSNRVLAANGVPDHAVGTFPNVNNPNTITAQNVAASYTLTPTYSGTATVLGGPRGSTGYVLNGVKIDASTAGTCPTGATATSSCSLINNSGAWSIEALTQSVFKFGTDSNNAHVQPSGEYHYHGMPEGFIALRGGGPTKMTLIGWAADGFPIYARYGHSVATDANSPLKKLTGSYVLKTTLGTGRPSTALAPLGTFAQDWEYSAGSGDLDECNGRTGVTPEFPNGIYHYFATDTYPFLQRCVKGAVSITGGGMPPP